MARSLKDVEAEKLNDSIVNKSDSAKLNQIIHKAELLLGNIGLIIDSKRIVFEIVNKEKMHDLHPSERNFVGLTCTISIDGGLHKIWLLEDRSYIYLLSVVAHEMGHTWCRDQKLHLSLFEEEGFCELLAFFVLSTQFSKLGNAWKEMMLHNQDPIYGDGFRYMKNRLENCCKGSWFKFLAFLKMNK